MTNNITTDPLKPSTFWALSFNKQCDRYHNYVQLKFSTTITCKWNQTIIALDALLTHRRLKDSQGFSHLYKMCKPYNVRGTW